MGETYRILVTGDSIISFTLLSSPHSHQLLHFSCYQMLTFLQAHIPERGAPLAGNSVHADKAFLDKYMPRFMGHLHYRIIDVSTIKELAKRWHPKEYKNVPRKGGSHRARDDIIESIEELKYYRTTLFKGWIIMPGVQGDFALVFCVSFFIISDVYPTISLHHLHRLQGMSSIGLHCFTFRSLYLP